MTKNTPIFIIGTGRCGSTLLSNLLNQHPAILSLSEFFLSVSDLCSLLPGLFSQNLLTGQEFWQLISRVMPKQDILLKHDLQFPEIIYPFYLESTKFTRNTGIPAILQTTLPHICESVAVSSNINADILYYQLAEYTSTYPLRTWSQHCQTLFSDLSNLFGKTAWIERSGSSIRMLPYLIKQFPDAKFVHIIRDGRNCAISMENHTGFRMGVISIMLTEILGYDPYESQRRDNINDLPDDLIQFLPENFSAEYFLNYRQSPSLFGIYWSGEIREALEALSTVPSEKVLTIKYEEILTNPSDRLRDLVMYIDENLEVSAWLTNVSTQIRSPRSQWQELTATEQGLLQEACAPGFEILQKKGIYW